MPTFFALILTSHSCNQINFSLRFHISHARPQAAALKWFASLRDFLNIRPEYLMTMSCQMVTPITQIFSISQTQPPTRTNKKPQRTEPQNTMTLVLDYHISSNPKIK